MNPLKTPKTFQEQYEIMKSKGIVFDSPEEAIDFLHQVNYYKFSAYFLPCRIGKDCYQPGTSFDKVKKTYEFDRKLRTIIFSVIEEIELYLRTQLSYYHAHKYGALGYLEPSNFNHLHNVDKFRGKIEECIKENKKSAVVVHHQKQYGGLFPIWVIVEFFSLGMLSYFYADMITSDQKAVAGLFNTTPVYLRSWLYCLTDLRNRCAHYSRLYFWKFSAVPKLFEERNSDGERLLFYQLIALKNLYTNAGEWNNVVMPQLSALVEEYSEYIDFSHIGFPDDWEDKLKKKVKALRAEIN